jgi:hypothetical protein
MSAPYPIAIVAVSGESLGKSLVIMRDLEIEADGFSATCKSAVLSCGHDFTRGHASLISSAAFSVTCSPHLTFTVKFWSPKLGDFYSCTITEPN